MAIITLSLGELEYLRYCGDDTLPAIIFLHEGLGSVAQWGRFPSAVSERTNSTVVVYSRHGYGGSAKTGPHPHDYLYREATEILPSVISELDIRHPPILVGHSDGATIATLYAAHYDIAGMVLIAPHIVMEERTLRGIHFARDHFDPIMQSLSAFHDDPQKLFDDWSRVWLSEEFAHFDISDALPSVSEPVLVIQGEDDEYGSLRQPELVTERVAGPVTSVILPRVGHHPHIQSPETIGMHIEKFVADINSEMLQLRSEPLL